MNSSEIYTLIGRCLVPDYTGSRCDEIRSVFENDTPNSTQFVRIASKHLVLQTVFANLTRCHLTDALAPDLLSHLQMVYEMNLERNAALLKEAGEIKELLGM
jgi:hypothetical protein